MVKLESLKKSDQFRKVLKEKNTLGLFLNFCSKNFFKAKRKDLLVLLWKIGNAVKRNKIRRKLKAIVKN